MESTAIVCDLYVFCFSHLFRLRMTFFPLFIYTWSFENRVSKKNQLILLLGYFKQ